MPTYCYECSSCSHYLEELQPIKSKPLEQCPKCSKKTLSRVITAPFFNAGPKTLGSQAEKNTKKMGHYEREEKRAMYKHKQETGRNKIRKRAAEKYGGEYIPYNEQSKTDAALMHKLGNMTPEQTTEYIKTGKT